jgi:poly-gamma-glutamate capsule biosynthesis protein CapA/YwtB (metallophosphatase superfamily)
MKSYQDKNILLALLAVALVAGLSGTVFENVKKQLTRANNLNQASVITATQNLAPKGPLPPEITLGFVGDIMMARGVETQVNKNLGGDFSKLFAKADFLKTPDIMFANLEGPISDVGADKHNLYSFRMNPKVTPLLRDAGIDVVSFANNHIGDWKRPAFEDTLARLSANGILACGAGMNKEEAIQPAVINENGFTVGFLCFSDVGPLDMAATSTQSGILLGSDPAFDAIVKSASQNVNALIVSFHFGEEYELVHTARQQELAHRAIDDGAVLVVGAHPHVPQDTELYKNRNIFYSLGNFIFDQNFSKDTAHGLFVTATLTGKDISNVILHQVQFDKNFVPSLVK